MDRWFVCHELYLEVLSDRGGATASRELGECRQKCDITKHNSVITHLKLLDPKSGAQLCGLFFFKMSQSNRYEW